MTQMLTDRYHDRLAGTLSCYDRIVITGTLPGACYAAGMTSFLNASTFEFLTIRASPSRCVTAFVKPHRRWRSPRGRESSTLPRRTSARKTSLPRCSRRVGIIRDWCMCSPPWKPATPTNPGTTNQVIRPFCAIPRANACTTISTGWTRFSDSSTCACRRGVHSGCSSTAMATVGWHTR
jgi:hypothetical protein